MSQTLEVAIAAGGTAGHINPALALADELRSRGHHVTFYGQPHKLEGTLVPQAGFELSEIRVTGFDRSQPWTLISALVRLRRATSALNARFAAEGAPDVAVGFGAYVEMPLLQWCGKHDVPYVIHEQNSVAGLANRTCARKASTVCVAFPGARDAFDERLGGGTRLVVTGNPVRASVVSASREAGRAAFGIDDDQTMVLVFGGSLGARHLNQAMTALAPELLARDKVRVVHSTGNELFAEVGESLNLPEDKKGRWQVMPYINNMGEALAAADLVVSRAGASSVAEIAALAVPAVLVPYPLATADHQTTNARLLTDAGAALLVADDELDKPSFAQSVLNLVDDAELRGQMRVAAQGLESARAAQRLADAVEEAAGV